VAIPAFILAYPRCSEGQNGFDALLLPELFGAFDSFVELLNARFGDARADRPAFGAIGGIIHVLLMSREVADVLLQQAPWMLRRIAGLRRAQLLGLAAQFLDDALNLAMPQQRLQVLTHLRRRGRLRPVHGL